MNEKTIKGATKAARAPLRVSATRTPARTPVATAVNPGELTVQNHPLARRHYRVATAAIEGFVDLVEHCVRVLIPGALIYARPRMGKTHAIDYLALHLARHRGDILTLRMSCEHHRSDFEGPFFSALLSAAGARHPQPKSVADKRFALMRRLSEQLQIRSGHIVVLFCDEAQRLSKHATHTPSNWGRAVAKWLRHCGAE